MNRMIGTAILALALGMGGSVLAQDDQLRINAQTTLTQYGYDVDPSLLTQDQLARFQTEFGAGTEVADEAQARQRIDQILYMDAGTATFVSEEMQALFADPAYPELRSNARTLLSEVGRDPDLAETLTIDQLAQMWFLQEGDSVASRPADLADRIQVILGDS